MGHDPEQYPKCNVGERYPELFWRSIFMSNLHINQHKWLIAKDMIDIIDCHKFRPDFCGGLDTDNIWNIGVEGQGQAHACTDEVNGVLLLTNTGGGSGDYIEVTQLCECWKLANCYPLYAECRFKLIDASHSHFWFGLVQGTTYFTPPNNFVVFEKDGTDLNLEISNALNGAGNEDLTGISLADDTWLRLGIHWDGSGTIRWFVIQDGDFPQTILATGSITTFIPTTEMSLGFGIRNAEALAKSMKVDYVKCEQKRVIE